jgi:ParB family chromosome partitioning protein
MRTFKTFVAFLRRADESMLSRLQVESSILIAATRGDPATILNDAASTYKVGTDAVASKVKQELAAKRRPRRH